MSLKEKVVVITGSSRGIGRAVAEACAREGARVVISSRREEGVQETRQELVGRGWSASGIKADVSIPDDLQKLLDHAVDRWGKVDVWINNAGISAGFRPLEEATTEELAGVVNVNLLGTLNACRLVIPYFVRQGAGVVLNMSGRGGRGDAAPFMAVYGATKAAITSLTKSLAREYRANPLSIHAVLPGMVDTEMLKGGPSSPRTAAVMDGLPLVLKAIGAPVDAVGSFVAGIAAQEPGVVTGKVYSWLKGWRLARGIALLAYYRATGRIGVGE